MTGDAPRTVERIIRVAMLGAIGAALAVVESFLPHPVPWMRLGVGNVAVVIALWTDGAWSALAVVAVKIVIAGLVGGTLAQPTTVAAAVSSGAAWAAMSVVRSAAGLIASGPVGVSIVGALVYGLTQVWFVGLWIARTPLWYMAPFVVGPGVVAGALTGLLAAYVLRRLESWTPQGGMRWPVNGQRASGCTARTFGGD